MGHEHMDALNGALREMREQGVDHLPRVESVYGDTVRLRVTLRDTAPEAAEVYGETLAENMRECGVRVAGVSAHRSPLVASVAECVITVSIPGYTTDPVAVEYDRRHDWGTTGRGHTLNTMWESTDGFVRLELDNGWSFTLPVKRAAGPKAIERSVRAALALHYRMLDIRAASEEDRESFCETGDDSDNDIPVDVPAPSPEPAPTPSPEPAPEPVYSAHMAQPGQPTSGPLLFCAPPSVELVDPDDFDSFA